MVRKRKACYLLATHFTLVTAKRLRIGWLVPSARRGDSVRVNDFLLPELDLFISFGIVGGISFRFKVHDLLAIASSGRLWGGSLLVLRDRLKFVR